ncbi:MAG: DUF362 domain-containing protein [Candidatus Woesearchaeota archaeon]
MQEVIYSKELSVEFLKALKEELKNNFKSCKKIAIKIHFGEPGNNYALKPEDTYPIIKILRDLKIDFFLFDSPVAYDSIRKTPEGQISNAIKKGWNNIGEVKSSNNSVAIKGKNLVFEVCKELIKADGVLVISHFKGHVCSGFGGAIKNLGMGALSKETKSRIHDGGSPVYVGGCVGCKKCVLSCPINGIRFDDKNKKPIFVNCYGCSNCCYNCPSKAIKPKINYFDVLLAEGASIAQSRFKNFYYINILKRITKECDCEKNPKGIISKDIGYLCSKDGVALDKASYDLVKNSEGDVFLEHNKKTGLEQINAAESFGMGSKDYKLREF